MVAIAVIPARGGSKRVPRKNILDFAGRPMIAWTIEAARSCGKFDRVLISTDDAEIAEIGRQYGAEVPFLRDSAADDQSHVSAATLVALTQAETYWGERYDTVAQLMPNCPLRGASAITDAMDAFATREEGFQISCFKYGWMNPWWAVTLDSKGHPKPLFADAMTRRSQDLETLYCPTGAIWIADVEALRKSGTFYGPGHAFHPLPWADAVDIDDWEDLEMAKSVKHMLDAGAVCDR